MRLIYFVQADFERRHALLGRTTIMNVEIANRLVALRKEKGLSQEELAARLGLSRQAVSKWERAESSPDTDNLIALAALYNVSLDELLNMSPEDRSDAAYATQERAEGTPEEAPPSPDPTAASEEEPSCSEESRRPEESVEDYYTRRWQKRHERRERRENRSEYVHVGPGGIHVKDDKDEVHVDWSGIHVTSAKDGAVHVDRNGVHVNDEDYTFEEAKERFEQGVHKKNWMMYFPYPILTVIVFLLFGFCAGLWHPAWVVFLTIPVWYGIAHWLSPKKPGKRQKSWMKSFPFPILTVVVFLLLGFCGNLWHPGWVVFLTIPVWYGIADWHTHRIRERVAADSAAESKQ
jgi:transcriptional regulator with XRE-family HTH domain